MLRSKPTSTNPRLRFVPRSANPRLPSEPRVANVWAELKTNIGLVRAEIGAVQGDIGSLEARLYRQLWLMAAGIVGLAVAPVKLLG